MGLNDILGTGGFGSIDLSGLLNKVFSFLGIFLLLVVLGLIVTALLVTRKRQKNKGDSFKIGWWVEVGERMETSHMTNVEEIIVPGTTLRIFYNKAKDLWLPRFTRGTGPKLFYVLLTPTSQLVNFTIPSLSKKLKEANLEYDHTDMLWAAENSREYIKRNYKDKATKWWQLYQNTIATAALILVVTFSFILIIYFMRGLITDMGEVANQLGKYAEQVCSNAQTSGVVPA